VGDYADEGRRPGCRARRIAAAGGSPASVAIRDRVDGDRTRGRRLAGCENRVKRAEGERLKASTGEPNAESRKQHMSQYDEVQRLLDAVRRRWRAELALRAWTRAALGAVAAVGIALVAA